MDIPRWCYVIGLLLFQRNGIAMDFQSPPLGRLVFLMLQL